jgi:hypothetical protein
MKPVVMGLDLSLRSTGIVAFPVDWAQDWARVVVGEAGYGLKDDASLIDHAARHRSVRDAILTFARQHRVTHAWVLGYAFNKAQVSRLAAAGELGGIVKLGLIDAGIMTQVVVESRARTLLGKAPRKGAKLWAVERLRRAGAPVSWSVDQFDAFVAGNWGLSELGSSALILRDQTELALQKSAV